MLCILLHLGTYYTVSGGSASKYVITGIREDKNGYKAFIYTTYYKEAIKITERVRTENLDKTSPACAVNIDAYPNGDIRGIYYYEYDGIN